MSDLIEEIKSYRLSEVIGKFVRLQNEGSGRKKCCCPFHHEKTPSFHLDDRKGLYHCFGCNAGGNIFTFIKNIKQCNFPQAIDYLCEILNIDKSKYQTNFEKNTEQEQEHATFYQAMDAIAEYYKMCLNKNHDAYNYVKTIREINNETEKEFLFGVANDNLEELIKYCKSKNIDNNFLLKSGIIRSKQNITGEQYEYLFFRNRIMIPIHNQYGKIVAFGGRIYKPNDNNAKYLNSNDNGYFKKGNILFNFHRAKKYIGNTSNNHIKQLIIVEGYMDAISLWQAGFRTAIAPLGTSITENHLRTIFNYCQDPIFLFDNDNAGKKATIRACEMIFSMLQIGYLPKICTLCGAKDVDEFLKKYSNNELQKQLDNAKEINKFIFDVKKQNYELTNPNSLSLMQKNIYELVNTIPDEILKKNYRNFYKNEFNKIITNDNVLHKNTYHYNKYQNFQKKYQETENQKKYTQFLSNPSIHSISIDFLEKQIISLLLKMPDLQDDLDTDESVISKLSPKNQQLLADLNKNTDEQKQLFYNQYINNSLCKNEQTTDTQKCMFDNLVIQWKLVKTENNNLSSDVSNQERKKILENKKKMLDELS